MAIVSPTSDRDVGQRLAEALRCQQLIGYRSAAEGASIRTALVAQKDSANGYAPGKWTRIDWMPFEHMAPYTWGFCLTAYEAATAQDAAATAPPARATPQTGCNGYPFSRLRADTAEEEVGRPNRGR